MQANRTISSRLNSGARCERGGSLNAATTARDNRQSRGSQSHQTTERVIVLRARMRQRAREKQSVLKDSLRSSDWMLAEH